MARDMSYSPVQAAIADLRRRLIDPQTPAKLATMRRDSQRATATRMRCAQAAQSLAGLNASAEDLQLATENEKAIAHQIDRARRAIGVAADAAVPELRAIADSLAQDAAELAALLKDIGEHVADHARRENPCAGLWPTADASARGLAVLARQLVP